MNKKIIILYVALAHYVSCGATEFDAGYYQLSTRILLPHLEEMRRIVSTEEICLSANDVTALFPILNQPGMVGCEIKSHPATAPTTVFDLACPGTNRATGTATVKVFEEKIDAVLNAKLGGKNMTFTQFAEAKRLGDCSPARALE